MSSSVDRKQRRMCDISASVATKQGSVTCLCNITCLLRLLEDNDGCVTCLLRFLANNTDVSQTASVSSKQHGCVTCLLRLLEDNDGCVISLLRLLQNNKMCDMSASVAGR